MNKNRIASLFGIFLVAVATGVIIYGLMGLYSARKTADAQSGLLFETFLLPGDMSELTEMRIEYRDPASHSTVPGETLKGLAQAADKVLKSHAYVAVVEKNKEMKVMNPNLAFDEVNFAKSLREPVGTPSAERQVRHGMRLIEHEAVSRTVMSLIHYSAEMFASFIYVTFGLVLILFAPRFTTKVVRSEPKGEEKAVDILA